MELQARSSARQAEGQPLPLVVLTQQSRQCRQLAFDFSLEYAMQHVLQGADGLAAAKKVAGSELQLTQAALIRNPKSYGSWHYRKWIIEHRLLPLEEELQLVQQ